MNRWQIDRFFTILSDELAEDALAILTGAAAGSAWGRIRPSMDIDFELRLKSKRPALWTKVEQAAAKASQATGIQANFSEDIDRWGMITLMDYRKHVVRYGHFGPLKVMLLEPAYWSIGKMTRYLEPDVQDMVEVFKRQRIPWKTLVAVWGTALRRSPHSAALAQFRRQVEDFLVTYGKPIWGKTFSQTVAVAQFYQKAKIKT